MSVHKTLPPANHALEEEATYRFTAVISIISLYAAMLPLYFSISSSFNMRQYPFHGLRHPPASASLMLRARENMVEGAKVCYYCMQQLGQLVREEVWE